MPNKLSEENSPYLLQHKDNPVNWYPWGAEALEKSKNEDKPIFLSIGYAACHWCHVMEHESFEDEDTAAIMNEHFINIKVDREERPDIDGIYMDAVVAMTGQGGWPMSVFLTTETKPFFAGTYFPPVNRYNMPAFKEVLLGASRAWQEDREKVIKSSEQITSHIKVENIAASGNDSLNIRTGMEASAIIAQSYDWDHGGWGAPPKFPQAMIIRYLLRRASRKDPMSSDMAVHALTEMAKGGMYDVLGGGFSRYSVDDQWLVPHFEKMLYDNALLARVYLHAFLITGNLYFKKICEETLDFVIREMRHPEGGFYSSLDADSEGEEGKFYVWDFNELQNLIEDKNDWELFRQAYDINPDGNFEGKIVLQRIQDDAELAKNLDLTEIEIQENLSGIHKNLFSERDKKVRPGTDDKILTSWNAWMLISFCEAARYLKREDYLQVAIENGNFLKENLFDGKVLLRSWREGKAKHNAYLEDYSSLALAYLSLYQSDPDTKWFQEANKLMEEILSHFYDPEDGFFDTREDHEKLLIRPKDLQDNATPSGSSLAVESLLQMAAYTGNGEWYDIAVTILSGMQSYMSKHPTGFGNWLCAYDMATNQINEIAIIGIKDDPKSELMINEVWKNYYPNNIVAISPADIPDNKQPPLLANKGLIGGKPSAYVCQNFVCKNPVTTPEELSSQLKSIS